MSILSEPTPSPAMRRASDFRPIADYGLLADCTSAALVDRDGSIDWLCMPHYDSPAVFARILDPNAGHWAIAPTGPSTSERRYLPGTLVIETTFTTATGTVRLIDAMAFADGQRGHDLGRDAPHEVLRLVEGVSGSVEMAMELAPRPEYGLVSPLFRKEEGGGRTFGGPNQIAVSAGVPVEVEDSTMRATFTVSERDRVGFGLHWASVVSARPMACPPDRVAARIEDTIERWRSTIEAIAFELTEDGLVLRYRNEAGLNADGLSGEEGTFAICTFWLVSALAKAGEIERAEALFAQLRSSANDLGLLGEEIDTATGEQLGNFPQAYSHIGFITAAWDIDQAKAAVGR